MAYNRSRRRSRRRSRGRSRGRSGGSTSRGAYQHPYGRSRRIPKYGSSRGGYRL